MIKSSSKASAIASLGCVLAAVACGSTEESTLNRGQRVAPSRLPAPATPEETSAPPPADSDAADPSDAAPAPGVPPAVPASAQWLFNGYCGTAQSGVCDMGRPGCPVTAILGEPCATPLDRCLGPETADGLRKKLACAPRGRPVWGLSGICKPGTTCENTKAPCPIDAPAAMDCAVEGDKCSTTGKVFGCLPRAGNVWVLNALCGSDFVDERACATYPDPVCPEAPNGTPCAVPGARCKTAGSNGKIFACVAR